MATIIKQIKIEDISAVQRVLQETWHDTYANFLSEKVIETATLTWHSSSALKTDLGDLNVFFAAATTPQGSIVGLITARKKVGTLWVSRLYILPSHQNQGIGHQLMRQACNAFTGIQNVKLEIEVQNHNARNFYAALGFKEIGRKEIEIGDCKLDSVILEKTLPNIK